MTVELFLKSLLIAAMVATVSVLAIGLFNMFKGGHEADERSNKMMRMRILFQAFALLIFSLLLLIKVK